MLYPQYCPCILKTYPLLGPTPYNKVFKKRLRSISASSCAVPPLTNEPTNTNEKQFVCWSFTNHFISSCRTKQKGANWAGQGDWKNDKFFDKWSKQSHLDPWYPWHSSLWRVMRVWPGKKFNFKKIIPHHILDQFKISVSGFKLYSRKYPQLIGTVKCTAKNLKCVSVLVFSVFKSKQIS